MGDVSESSQRELTGQLLELSQLVDPSEVLAASSVDYIANTQTWSTAKDKKPRLVLRPTTTESLTKIVKYLHNTNLDYKVRSRGFGSASATDVLISLTAFDDFEFNKEGEYVILGAGGTWRGYYDRMEAATQDWTIVAARTPSIGIGGSTLCSGFSWLSAEYGCVSDPANLLDAHVITADGRAFWAAETDPDLLWAMRHRNRLRNRHTLQVPCSSVSRERQHMGWTHPYSTHEGCGGGKGHLEYGGEGQTW